jgi:hypothetical protein
MEQMFVGGAVNGLKSGSPQSDQPTMRSTPAGSFSIGLKTGSIPSADASVGG